MPNPHDRSQETLPNLQAEQQSLETLRASIAALSAEVTHLESQVSAHPTTALVLPEDLSISPDPPPRVQGLVTRIMQTHALSLSLASLRKSKQQP